MNLSRRGFLGSCALAGLATGACAGAVAAPRPWKAGLGLNGFMSSAGAYQREYPIWEVLDFAAKTGFDGIELVEGWPMGGYPLHDDARRVNALKRMYDQYGLQIYTIQTGGSGAYAADAARREAWIDGFRDRVKLCAALGCDFIGHWPGGGLEGNPDVDHAIQNLVTSYRAASEICAEAGLYLSFEIEPPFVFNTEEHLARILTEVDHPACRTNYDPSHFDLMTGGRGKPEEMLSRVGVDRIGHVHLTDTDGTLYKGTSRHLACGDGHCDIAASLDVLHQGGYAGWIMIDGWMIDDVYDAARKGIQAIQTAQRGTTSH